MNTKITISQGISERRHNLCMPEKIGFLVPKKNSSSVPLIYFN